MIAKILIVLLLVLFFFLGAFIGKATSADFPDSLKFLTKFPIIAGGICTEKSTQKEFACEYRLDMETGNSYLIIWDGEELHEVIWADAKGEFETIFKAAKKLRL